MKYKKFLIIPLLIFIYIFFIVDLLVNYSPGIGATTTTRPAGEGEQIGVGEKIVVTVTRPYFFGLFRLPVYTNSIGYIGQYHEWFFYFVGILTVVFFLMEVLGIQIRRKKYERKEEVRRRGDKMVKKPRAKGLLKAILYGVVFGFVIYVLSGDAGAGVGLGLLLMYLENKLK